MTHATVIAHHLKAKGWTPARLHREVAAYGLDVSPPAVYNWTKGDAKPSSAAWAVLIEVLDITDHEVVKVAKTAGVAS